MGSGINNLELATDMMEFSDESIELKVEDFEVVINPVGAWVEAVHLNGREVLFTKRTLSIDGKEKIRGGMHVCLPQFGPDEGSFSLPQHGFGRDVNWEVKEKSSEKVVMTFDGSKGEYGVDSSYPAGLVATLAYEITEDEEGATLGTLLTVLNNGSDDIPIAPAFHPYFSKDSEEQLGFSLPVDINSPKDWVKPTSHEMNTSFVMSIGARRIRITSKELKQYVLWSDLPNNYVCFEPTRLGADFDSDKGREIVQPREERMYSFTTTLLN